MYDLYDLVHDTGGSCKNCMVWDKFSGLSLYHSGIHRRVAQHIATTRKDPHDPHNCRSSLPKVINCCFSHKPVAKKLAWKVGQGRSIRRKKRARSTALSCVRVQWRVFILSQHLVRTAVARVSQNEPWSTQLFRQLPRTWYGISHHPRI